MKIGPDAKTVTAICTSNPDTIIVRGENLAEDLIGGVSFTDHIWLLVVGGLPTAAQRRILDSALVAIAEHGLVPSVVAARMTLAAGPEAIQGAVAAGLLGCGSVILGRSQAAGEFLNKVVTFAGDGDLNGPAREVITSYRAERRPVPGYGHPLHKGGDPRALKLFAVARETGQFGRHCEAAYAAEALLPEITGRDLSMNISAAIPAVLLDAGYPLLALKGVPLLARTASLVAHLLEEQTTPIGFHMAHSASSSIDYNGTAPDGFVPDEK